MEYICGGVACGAFIETGNSCQSGWSIIIGGGYINQLLYPTYYVHQSYRHFAQWLGQCLDILLCGTATANYYVYRHLVQWSHSDTMHNCSQLLQHMCWIKMYSCIHDLLQWHRSQFAVAVKKQRRFFCGQLNARCNIRFYLRFMQQNFGQ